MIIIVEGPDGLGKSTLCAKLSEKLGYPVYKDANSDDGLLKHREYILGHDTGTMNMAMLTDADVILDRSFPSEVVYSHAMKRDYDRKAYETMEWELKFRKHLAVLVTCQSRDAGWEMALYRGVSDIQESAWKRLWDEYWYYVQHSQLEWYKVFAEDQLEVQVLQILWRLGY